MTTTTTGKATAGKADDAIRALGVEAGVAGNSLLVAICEVALWGESDTAASLPAKDRDRVRGLARASARQLVAAVFVKRRAAAKR